MRHLIAELTDLKNHHNKNSFVSARFDANHINRIIYEGRITENAWYFELARLMKPIEETGSMSMLEDANADENEGARKMSRKGRKRGARSLGCYLFLAYVEQYLERKEVSVTKSSLEELRRKARYLNMVLTDLKKSGRISSASLRKMIEADIRVIIKWMDEQGHENSYNAKHPGFIKDIC